MRILIMGGTAFVGRHIALAALGSGHEVTLFHRGQTGAGLFPAATHLTGDRDESLAALSDGSWDATIDVSGYLPRQVTSLAQALGGRGGQYLFISSVSVYQPPLAPGFGERPATFALAVVVTYLALAALFESFRDPLIILVSVPMSIAGALLFVWLGVGGASINLFTEVGLVTLMGLISKHGILIVEVANEQQKLGRSKREAIERACALRLRPILMTTAAMVLGVLPLVFATGAGAASRYVMGLVIATGLAIGTLFTLFVVPAFYLVLARTHVAEPVRAPILLHASAIASE